MENFELREYINKFGDYPFLPMMASYDDDIYQYLLSMAILREKPLTEQEINEAYKNKVDIVEEETTKPNEEKGENEMEEKKIRDLLKRYGAEDNEIENFMADLKDTKEEIKEEIEEDDDYVLSPKNLEVLKATEEGKDLIMRAPEMTKEELKKAIYDFLNNKKSE